MIRFRNIVILVFSMILVGCTDGTFGNRNNEIKRIVFATGGCFGECPVQTIDMDSSLSVKYYGVKNTDYRGFYNGKVSQGFWDTLNIKFKQLDFQKLDSSYQHSVDDLYTEIFVFYDGNKTKHIVGQSASLPGNVMNVYEWIMESIGTIHLVKINDSIVFPTQIERLLTPPPPMPEGLRFTE